jgi:Mg2+/Co2+ transporter CorB
MEIYFVGINRALKKNNYIFNKIKTKNRAEQKKQQSVNKALPDLFEVISIIEISTTVISIILSSVITGVYVH